MNKYDIVYIIMVIIILGMVYCYNNIIYDKDIEIQSWKNEYIIQNNIIKSQDDLISKQNIQINDTEQYYKSIIKIKDFQIDAKELNMKPTLAEVQDFLLQDQTNYNEYIPYVFVCSQFAALTVRNAIDKGIYSCVVTVSLDTDFDDIPDAGHVIIAFDTADNGITYFEPQDDRYEPVYMYVGMNWGHSHGHIVIDYDSCFERVI